MNSRRFDFGQAASAAQFDRQHRNYGKSHVLADTSDLEAALREIPVGPGARALDVATGGGHAALCLARAGWRVTIGDVSLRMLESAKALLIEQGHAVEALLFPAEEMPFADRTFDLVNVRVAPHHFSSPLTFMREVFRVLKPGGHFVLIDGTVPDHDVETAEWLNRVEKWRDPSHGELLAPAKWRELSASAGLEVLRTSVHRLEQPGLSWYFETAATPVPNRHKVLEAVRTASASVREEMRLVNDGDATRWWWPMLTLIARRPEEC